MTIRDLVAEYLQITPQRGDEWLIKCPHPDHDDHKPSATIYVGEPMLRLRGGKEVRRLPGMYHCFSCGRSGRISNEAIENYQPSTNRNLEVLEANLDALDAAVRIYPEAWLDLYDFPGGVHPYWLSRFSEATARKHRLGYDPETDAGTYPLRDPHGAVRGVVLRSLDTQATGWKYRYPKGIDLHASGWLYGYAEAVREGASVVAVCEGALDAVACDEAGTPALGIYGSRLSVAQASMINKLYPHKIILCFDSDQAGIEATMRVIEMGLDCFNLCAVSLPAGTKDIAELDVATRAEVLRHARPIDAHVHI